MDYRAPMTRAEFDAIPMKPTNPTYHLWERLLYENPQLVDTDASAQSHFTPGMRLFALLSEFGGQVSNGGITQFFWNRPTDVPLVEEALRRLGEGELLALYTRAVETVIGKEADWAKLRDAAYRDPKAPDWEPFRQSYELLDLGWFDDAYFDKHGYNDRREWVMLGEGLRTPFLRRLAAWVKAHPEEFITG